MLLGKLALAGLCAAALAAGDEWDLALQSGRLKYKSGNLQDAESSYTRALKLAQAAGDRGRTANSLTYLGVLMRDQDRFSEAGPLFEQALEIYSELGDRSNIARSKNNVASILQVTGKAPQAEALYREAIGEADADAEIHVIASANLALILASRGELVQSAEVLESARRTADAARLPEEARGSLFNQMGVLARKRGNYDEAERHLTKALELRRAALGKGHIETAVVENNLGDLYAAQGRYEQAEALLRKSAGTCKAIVRGSSRCSSMLNNLASIEQNTGRLGEAETHFQDAIELAKSAGAAGHVVRAAALNNLGKIYVAEKRLTEARAAYDAALEAWRAAGSLDHPDYASTLTNIGGLYLAEKKFDRAQEMMQKALEIDERLLGKNHWKTAVDLNNLAAVAVRRKRLEDAEELLRRSYEIERGHDAASGRFAGTAMNLGEVLAMRKKWDEAAACYGEALRIWEKRPELSQEAQLNVLLRYEQILRNTQEYARAEQVAAEAMRIRVRAAVEKSAAERSLVAR